MFIFILLLIAVFVWMAVTFRSRMQVRDCRWRENRTKDTGAGKYFLCTNCGTETWTADRKPPKVCVRPETD